MEIMGWPAWLVLTGLAVGTLFLGSLLRATGRILLVGILVVFLFSKFELVNEWWQGVWNGATVAAKSHTRLPR